MQVGLIICLRSGVLMRSKSNNFEFNIFTPKTNTQKVKILAIDLANYPDMTAVVYSDGSVEVLDNEEAK